MATITLQGNAIETSGDLPSVGKPAPSFTLTKTDLSDCSLADYGGKKIVLNIFPSIDTPVCAASVRRFNQEAAADDTTVLCVSADLPFAHQRFCETEGIKNVLPLSVFRAPDFGKKYGILITNGPVQGLLARAIVIVDRSGAVAYTQLVPEIVQEPDYDAALAALRAIS